MNIANRNEKRISSLVMLLEENKAVEFVYNEFYYEVFESSSSDGYIVNVFSDDEKDEYGEYLEKNEVDGGLCSGSARDAVEFML